ncbi:MAG TPA: hypothetical protein VIF37_12980 [Methylobacter sp.]|jgi:hypothetical protein
MDIKFPPYEKRLPGLLPSPDDLDRFKKYENEDMLRMQTLCFKHGIQESPSMWYDLALILARELYPERKKAGRKSKWTDLNKCYVVVEIERMMGGGVKTVDSAAYQLSKKEPWRSFIETKDLDTTSADPGEVLRKIYFSTHKDKWADMWRDAFCYHELTGSIDLWDKIIFDEFNNP